MESLFEYFTLRDVLLYSALFLATWLSYKAGIEPFLSPIRRVSNGAILEKWVPYSQRYLVLALVGLALWLASGISLNKYRCE